MLFRSMAAPAGNIDVESSHGEIKLVVPRSSRFRLEATSVNGQVRTIGFRELPQKALANLSATIGSDGPTVKLRTSYKKITIQTSGARQAQDEDIVSWAPARMNGQRARAFDVGL